MSFKNSFPFNSHIWLWQVQQLIHWRPRKRNIKNEIKQPRFLHLPFSLQFVKLQLLPRLKPTVTRHHHQKSKHRPYCFSFTCHKKGVFKTSNLESKGQQEVTKMHSDFSLLLVAVGIGSFQESSTPAPPTSTQEEREPNSEKENKPQREIVWKKSGFRMLRVSFVLSVANSWRVKQSKMHLSYHEPSGCLLTSRKNRVQPGTKVSMATGNWDPHRH